MSALGDRLKRVESPAARSVLLRGASTAHYVVRGHFVARWRVRAYLCANPTAKLQLGCGPNRIPGWLNSDLISGDIHLDIAARRLPLPQQTFDFVFGEHVIEHISEAEGRRLLQEMHRILKPGGVLRLTTPDLVKIVAIYQDRNRVITRSDYARFLDTITGKHHEHASQVLNNYLRLWGHRYVYDEEDLRQKLVSAGFRDIVRLESGESPHPELRSLERHGGAEWVNQAEAMSLEATRP